MWHPGENLRKLVTLVDNAEGGNAEAEKLVRKIMAGCADVCPVAVLVKTARCLIDAHREELKAEAGGN